MYVAGAKLESTLLMESTSQPTNLLVTFLEYCSVISQDIKGWSTFVNSCLLLHRTCCWYGVNIVQITHAMVIVLLTCFTAVSFLFFFQCDDSELRWLIVVKLCHMIRSVFNFIMPGCPEKKIWWPKTCKIRHCFRQLQTLIANISGNDGDIQNRKDVIDSNSSCVRRNVRWTLVH